MARSLLRQMERSRFPSVALPCAWEGLARNPGRAAHLGDHPPQVKGMARNSSRPAAIGTGQMQRIVQKQAVYYRFSILLIDDKANQAY
ncbi:hypothetical protein ACFQFS_08920 [Novosphingobium lubricantis]